MLFKTAKSGPNHTYGGSSAVITPHPIHSLFIGLVLLTVTCCSSKISPSHAPTRIEFGHGGGFAGIEYRYTLLPDGRLFESKSENVFLKRIDLRIAKQLFNNIESISTSMLAINEPGNTYSYLLYVDGENKARYVWNSDNRSTLRTNLQINHNVLIALISPPSKNRN